MVHPVLVEPQVLMALMVLQVQLEHLEPQELQVQMVLQAQVELQV